MKKPIPRRITQGEIQLYMVSNKTFYVDDYWGIANEISYNKRTKFRAIKFIERKPRFYKAKYLTK